MPKLVVKEEKLLRQVLAVFFSLCVAIVLWEAVGHGHRQCWRPLPLQQSLSEAALMRSRHHQTVQLAWSGP